MRRPLAVAVLASLLAMCATRPARHIPSIDDLTLDEKIGQLFVVGAHGVFMSESSPAYRNLLHHVRDNHVGGLIWFVSNVYETAMINKQLQRQSRVPLLVSADLESGIGMRFADTTVWPSAMALAATGDPSLAEQEGRVVAREARAIGINHILAPVADVNVDPDNPVINTRSFGEDPANVARFVAAFIKGVQSERVLACAKHFPGHGDTHTDSHRSLPILNVTRERLDRVELVPFRAAIDAKVGSIMPGHLSVPVLDSTRAPVRAMPASENPYGTKPDEVPEEATLPATVSPKMIDGLLRQELHFDGLVVSDAFDMGGLTEHFDVGEAAIRAIEAGEDQILMSPDTDAAITAVKAAVKSGRISEARIDESVRRILAAKAFVGAEGPADADEIFKNVDNEEHRKVASEIARRALTLVREQAGVLPLKRDARVAIITVSEFPESVSPLAELEREIRARLKTPPQVLLIDARTCRDDVATIAASASKADVVIFALAIRARSGAGHIAIPELARNAIASIKAPSIAIAFGTPYLSREIPTVGTYFCAYGIQHVMQRAAAAAIFGEIKGEGKLPVTVQQ